MGWPPGLRDLAAADEEKRRRSRPPPERLRSFKVNRVPRTPTGADGRTSVDTRKSGGLPLLRSSCTSRRPRTIRPGFRDSARPGQAPAPTLSRLCPFRSGCTANRSMTGGCLKHHKSRIIDRTADNKYLFTPHCLFFRTLQTLSVQALRLQRGQMRRLETANRPSVS